MQDTTPEELKTAQEHYLEHFICAAAKHPPATRIGYSHTVCLCGAWSRPIIWPASDDVVSEVTVNALKAELKMEKALRMVCQGVIDRAIGELRDAAPATALTLREEYQRLITQVIEGRLGEDSVD